MHKNTLADIVIKSLKFANSAVESSYEFPELNLRISEDLNFRDKISEFYQGYRQGYANHNLLRSMLGYMASLHDENYGEFIAINIKRWKRIQVYSSIFFFWRRSLQKQIKQGLQRLENFYYECEARNDTAKELREMPTEMLANVMDEQWDEIKEVWEDMGKKKEIKPQKTKKFS